MSKNKAVQIKLDNTLYRNAKIGLFQLDTTWQEFLETYIRLKFGKEKKNGQQKNK